MELTTAPSPSVSHCNTVSTVLLMNSLAEALGMSLPGCTSIPAACRERGQMAYAAGRRIADLMREDVRPLTIMTRLAFESAVMVALVLGALTNYLSHFIAIVCHMGIELSPEDQQRHGELAPLLVNCIPVGEYLGENFYRLGGVPAVLRQLDAGGLLRRGCPIVSGRTIGTVADTAPAADREVIFPVDMSPKYRVGFIVLPGNFSDSTIVKMSVVGEVFRQTYLSESGAENIFGMRATVFDSPENYHTRINDSALAIDERYILVIHGRGTVGYPGNAEVVNMTPSAALVKQGIKSLPHVGDGWQSGASTNLSTLNISLEAATGGGLALLRTSDHICVDFDARRVDVLVDAEKLEHRHESVTFSVPQLQTPRQEIYRQSVGQLSTGGCLEPAALYPNVIETRGNPRHSH